MPRCAARLLVVTMALAILVAGWAAPAMAGDDSGIVRVRSAHPMAATVDKLKQAIIGRGIILFAEIDQAKLAGDAGVELHPSVLLVFGNPRLGAQFMTSEPVAGLDWPVRLLVFEDRDGMWAAYTGFPVIARRYRIANRQAAFDTAARVVASITATIAGEQP